MSLQIANPQVIAKVEQAARATGLSKTAVVDRALDVFVRELAQAGQPDRMAALLEQIDRIPDRADAHDPLEWDATGLPV